MSETIAERLNLLRERIAVAAVAAGRNAADVSLVVVTKNATVAEVASAARAGQRDFGENYVAAAEARIAGLASELSEEMMQSLSWHMVGQLQSNKAARAARRFGLIHSLSSISAARTISKAMLGASTTARVLLQVRLGGGEQRGGVEAAQVLSLARAVTELGGIEIDGLMGVAPLGEQPRPHFVRLRALLEDLRGQQLPHAPLGELSAGMSGDFEDAVAEGSTLVRIGRAVFGP